MQVPSLQLTTLKEEMQVMRRDNLPQRSLFQMLQELVLRDLMYQQLSIDKIFKVLTQETDQQMAALKVKFCMVLQMTKL